MLALMRMLRIPIRHDHLRQAQPVENRSMPGLDAVIDGDIIENNAFAVVEADVQVPILPVEFTATERKRNALWLRDIEGLDVGAEAGGLAGFG